MISKKLKIGFNFFFAATLAAWVVTFFSFKDNAYTVFPQTPFEIYPLTDSIAGGFSTSEITTSETSIAAKINIRSGKAFPYAGFGFNLASTHNRPSGYFDFSKYDSLEVFIATGRMQSAKIRIVTDDPVYSRQGDYLSYRPLEQSIKTSFAFAPVKFSMLDFKTPEWWLAAQGLDKDDGLTYFYRSLRLEIFNGEGILRGIPDDIEIKSFRMWGKNHKFISGMFLAIGFWAILLVAFIFALFYKPSDKALQKKQLSKAAHLLATTDKSVAEISIELELKNSAQLEKLFKKAYGKKPLEYRREHHAKTLEP